MIGSPLVVSIKRRVKLVTFDNDRRYESLSFSYQALSVFFCDDHISHPFLIRSQIMIASAMVIDRLITASSMQRVNAVLNMTSDVFFVEPFD